MSYSLMTDVTRESLAAALASTAVPLMNYRSYEDAADVILAELEKQALPSPAPEPPPDREGLSAAVWDALEALPGFNEAMERGTAEIAAGLIHPLHDVEERAAQPAPDLDPTRLMELARDLAFRVHAIAGDYGQDHAPTGDWPAVWTAWDRFMAEYSRLQARESGGEP